MILQKSDSLLTNKTPPQYIDLWDILRTISDLFIVYTLTTNSYLTAQQAHIPFCVLTGTYQRNRHTEWWHTRKNTTNHPTNDPGAAKPANERKRLFDFFKLL